MIFVAFIFENYFLIVVTPKINDDYDDENDYSSLYYSFIYSLYLAIVQLQNPINSYHLTTHLHFYCLKSKATEASIKMKIIIVSKFKG